MESNNELQEIVLISLLKDNYLLSTALPEIESSFFNNLEYRIIFKSLADYYNEYNKLPDRRSLCVCIADNWDASFGNIVDVKRKVNEFYGEEKPDEDFSVDKITTFVKRRKVEKALRNIISNMKDNDGRFESGIENAADELLESIQINLAKGEIFKMNELDNIFQVRKEAVGTSSSPTVIKSSISSINRRLQFGGYKPGDLVLFVAAPGVGKTSFMINEGVEASKSGYHVLHIFVGDMTKYDGFIRYAAAFSGKKQGEITNMNVEDQHDFIKDYDAGGCVSRISILSYPAESLTVDELIETVKRSQEEEGIHYDMVVVDYPDNLIPEDDMMYQSSGTIFNKLSCLARTNSSVVLAGSQPKIKYYGNEVIPMEAAAESSKKQQIIDVMITMGKPHKNFPLASLHLAKVRRGEEGGIIRAKTDWARCRINEITRKEYEELKSELGRNSELVN